jgi:hypothetical protein
MSVAEAWSRIEAWLAQNAPELGATLRPPASEDAIRALEAKLDRPLPPDLRESLAIHDGQSAEGRLLWCLESWQLASVEDARRELDVWSKKPCWRPGLVPIALSSGDLLAVDLTRPASGWIFASAETDELVEREQGPIAVWLESFADDLRRGRMAIGARGELEPRWPVDAEIRIARAADALVERLAETDAPHEATDAQELALADALASALDQPAWAIASEFSLARALWNAWDRWEQR